MTSNLKLVTFLMLTILMNSCSSDKDSFTKAYALEHLNKCEEKRPNVTHYNISKSSINVQVAMDTTIDNAGVREYKLLMKLVKAGYLKSEIITASSSGKTYDSYTFSALPKSQEYELASNNPNKMKFIMYETKVIAIKNIKMIDAIKADVTVEYKKVKTPFYIAEYDVSTNQNVAVKPDTYEETITFRKSKTNGWLFCQL